SRRDDLAMHLSPEDLVDIAEGSRSESASPHLSGCEVCQAQVRDLRAMLSAARDTDVPEPSPLFWDHLSSRVSEAVAAEAAGARVKGSRSFGEWLRGLTGARAFQASVAVAAGLLIAIVLSSRAMAPAPAPVPPSMVTVTPPAAAVAEVAPEQFN